MNRWLTHAYEDRLLDIRGGRIDRAKFSKHFGLRGGTFMVRHPEIRRLFESFDDRASNDGYTPASWDNELARLRDGLNGIVTLDKDRLRVNRVTLSSTTGIDIGRFGLPRYDNLVSAKEREILQQAKSSRIDPFLHGRVHAFSDLLKIWPKPFLERLGVRFKQVLAAYGPDMTKQQHLRMQSLLSWIGTSEHASCKAVLAEARQHNRVLSEDQWEDAVFAWRDTVVATVAAGRRAHGGADGIIATMRSVLGHMASGGILPPLSDLPGIKRAARHVRHLDSLVELAPSAETRRETKEFARRILIETANRIGIETGHDDQKFLASIRVKHDEDPAQAVRALLQLRLDAVRNRAASLMSAAQSDFELGCDLLEAANIEPAVFMRNYLNRDSDHQRRLLVREFFPPATSEENLAMGRGNLLALIKADHGGVPPPADGPDGQFFGKRYNAYGGKGMFERLLGVHRDAAAAALTLYLVDSGANISVGRTLDADALESSDLAGHRRITGIKARAQGKPIIVDLPADSQTIRALEWLQARLAPLAERASPEDADRLMLIAVGTRIGLMEPWWFTGWFKNFASDLPCLAGIDVTPNMLRPSVLLHAALSNDGRLAVGMAIGQHGLAVTQGYQQKHPVRLIYDEHVRRFQTAFETLVLAAVPEAAALLGVDNEVLAERLKALRPTGLGTFCAAPSDQGSPACSSVDCWNDCPHLAIVAEVEAMATLRLWQASLRECAADWERDRPERWEACWLPWLCLVDAVEHRMSRGTLLSIWNRAGRRADEIAATTGYTPPQPW